MTTRLSQPISRLRSTSRRRGPGETVPRPPAPEARAREAGGPIDTARYACSCGYVFAAPVSASVSCPHCGADQDW